MGIQACRTISDSDGGNTRYLNTAEDVIVAVGEELHPAVAGSISVDEAVTRAAMRAEALLAG